MSTLFYLICRETKKRLWVGQTSGRGPFRFYNAELEHARQSAFLSAHLDKQLEFVGDWIWESEPDYFYDWIYAGELHPGDWDFENDKPIEKETAGRE